MRNHRHIAALGLLMVLIHLAACVSGTVQPYTADSAVQPASDGENRLWYQAGKFERELKKSGQIYENEALTAYLQQIMDRLYPEFKGHIRVYILKAPVLNAFALPNGSIYVNTGLLAAMDNEAQVATVLAHEGVHFINKHAALQRENYHNATGLRMAVAVLGIPYLADLAAISSIFGYSKHHEREADAMGHARLLAAGYDVNESPKAFEHLLIEANASEVEEPFFFSTHPTLASRIENFEALNAATAESGKRVGADSYQAQMGCLRMEVLKEKVVVGKYDAVIAVLSDDQALDRYGDRSIFFLGEAFRLRNEPGDSEKAMEAYERSKEKWPDFAPVYRSMGIVHLKAGDYQEAISHFETYLKSAPEADDRAFIMMYLNEARTKADQTR